MVESLLDGVLMTSREGSEDQFTTPWSTRVHADLIALGCCLNDLGQVGEVELGVDSLRVHVEGHSDKIDVTCALSTAEQATLDTVGTGHQTELGGGDTRATIIVSVQRHDDMLTVRNIAAEVFNLEIIFEVSKCVKSVFKLASSLADILGRRSCWEWPPRQSQAS